MRAPLAFSSETKRRLVHLLIEAFTQDIQQREEELLDLLTRPPPPLPRPLGSADEEPKLRMTISNLIEDRRLLQAVEALPETAAPVAEVFSVVQTRQGEQDTWYFITPCQYDFEREVQLDALRIHCVFLRHSLVGTRRGDTYSTGGAWDIYTGEMFKEPLEHRIIDIF